MCLKKQQVMVRSELMIFDSLRHTSLGVVEMDLVGPS